ncbi:Partitioning defective 3-like [Papilio machaon]|uniref:Partitioning defective 3-like n=1 Tax=Papilio machaon TaxID=76193 RepID=A0A194QKU9_PAPMA|nr:Partitioning defective 3-like [Papilio machaon]
MKVTVCFGSVRVLVPCGAGDLLVRDLVREATHRYKKATGQNMIFLLWNARLKPSKNHFRGNVSILNRQHALAVLGRCGQTRFTLELLEFQNKMSYFP